jgi:uncharacterized membrane protein
VTLPPALRVGARLLLAAAMVSVGVLHFTDPAPFVRIVPAALPAPLLLVWLSGAAEVVLGVLVLVPRPAARRLARYGLLALLIAVFPANLNMALNGVQLDPAAPLPLWALWARLPMQLVFAAWAWWVTQEPVTWRSG